MNQEGLRGLVAVVELGSVVAAARRLGISRPTLRRRLDELEAEVGVPLLVRTRRGSVATEAGEHLARRGRERLREDAALLAEVRELGGEPAGELSVVLPTGAAPQMVAAIIRVMRQRYPKLVTRVQTVTDPIAALEQGVDVALAFGPRQPGGRWVSMELRQIRRQLMASPDYLDRFGHPQTLAELVEHDLLAWSPPDGSAHRWPLRGGGVLDVELILQSPDGQLIRQVVAHGLGIGLVLESDLPGLGPPLVPVMVDVVGDAVPGRIIVPAALEGHARIKALLSTLRAFLATRDARPVHPGE